MATSTIDTPQELDGQELSASCFIDGAWVQGEGESHADVVNPATEESLVRMRFAATSTHGRWRKAISCISGTMGATGCWENWSPRALPLPGCAWDRNRLWRRPEQ